MAKQKFNFQRPIENTSKITNRAESLTQKLSQHQSEHRSFEEFKVIKIPRSKIKTNPKNDYPIEDIEKLADSILRFGLQQPLVVLYDIDTDMYILEAGERRTTALDLLIKKFQSYNGSGEDIDYQNYIRHVQEFEYGYPCKINKGIKEDMSEEDRQKAEAESEARLILTNEEVRSLDPSIRQKKIKRLEELYKIIFAESGKKINVIDQLAQDTGLGKTQIKAYRSIDKLIPELQEEFHQHNITLKEGNSYSKLSEEEQKTIYELIQSGKKISVEEAERMKKQQASATEEIARLQESLKKSSLQYQAELQRLRTENNSELVKKQNDIDALRKMLDISKSEKRQQDREQSEKIRQEYKSQIDSLIREKDKLTHEYAQKEAELQEAIKKNEQDRTDKLTGIKVALEYEAAMENWKTATRKLVSSYKNYKVLNTDGSLADIEATTEKYLNSLLN